MISAAFACSAGRELVDELSDGARGFVDRRQVLALLVEGVLFVRGPEREVAELQRAKRALARSLVGVAVDVKTPGSQKRPDAAREQREVANRMAAVPIDHRLQTLTHPAGVATGRKQKNEVFDVADAGQRTMATVMTISQGCRRAIRCWTSASRSSTRADPQPGRRSSSRHDRSGRRRGRRIRLSRPRAARQDRQSSPHVSPA